MFKGKCRIAVNYNIARVYYLKHQIHLRVHFILKGKH